MNKSFAVIFTYLILLAVPAFVSASTTSGTIDTTNRYAWSENAGWIDFGTTAGAVTITDSGLTGYSYGENIGWISLNCSNTSSCGANPYAVTNDGNGNLSGYAWSENTGWINFKPSAGGVIINSSGVFTGSAYSENIGWINFTGDHPGTTDWRPASVRNASSPSTPTPIPTLSGGSSSSSGGSVSTAQLAALLAPSASTTAYLNSLQNCPTGVGCTPETPTASTCPTGFICTPIASSTNKIPASAGMTNAVFTRNLIIGSTGSDIKALQQYLNSHGFTVAVSGPGSPGNETTKFGDLTKSALVKFQKANGISASGWFGPITKAFINSH